jgi:hypothetical protein
MIRHATMLALLLAAALSLILFVVKYQVSDLEQELTELDRAIVQERRAIHVLKAEWSHLNDPARLAGLVERHLELAPVSPDQLGTLRELPARPDMPVQQDDPVLPKARLTASGVAP